MLGLQHGRLSANRHTCPVALGNMHMYTLPCVPGCTALKLAAPRRPCSHVYREDWVALAEPQQVFHFDFHEAERNMQPVSDMLQFTFTQVGGWMGLGGVGRWAAAGQGGAGGQADLFLCLLF